MWSVMADGGWCVCVCVQWTLYMLHGGHESIVHFHCSLKWRITRTWYLPIDRSTKCEFRNTDCCFNWLECVCIIILYTLGPCANGVWRRTQHRHDSNGAPIRRVIYFDGSFRKLESWMKSSARREENSSRHFVLLGKRSRIVNWHTIIYWNCSAGKSDRSNDKCTTFTIIQFMFHQRSNAEMFSISIGVFCFPSTRFSCFCFVSNEKGSNRSLYFEQKNSISGEQNKPPLHWVCKSLSIHSFGSTPKKWCWRDTMNKTCIHWFALIMRPVIRSSPHGIA